MRKVAILGCFVILMGLTGCGGGGSDSGTGTTTGTGAGASTAGSLSDSIIGTWRYTTSNSNTTTTLTSTYNSSGTVSSILDTRSNNISTTCTANTHYQVSGDTVTYSSYTLYCTGNNNSTVNPGSSKCSISGNRLICTSDGFTSESIRQ
jgi:hypothetical protein